jgi:ornithine cyclodeaminase/alanine dehydrogenase-like protein (mu-crystallin family)
VTVLLDRAAVRALLGWPEVLAAVRGAYLAAAGGGTLAPASSHVPLPGGALHLKAGGTTRPGLVSVKANMRPDAAAATGLILLYDTEGWTARAILDSADLTAWRTAAAAVTGAMALGAGPGAAVAILGAGPLGAAALDAVRHALEPSAVHAWSRDQARAAALGPAGTVTVHSTPAAAVAGADLVITCTPSREPLVAAADLRPGAVVCAMGSDSPGKRELDPDVLRGAVVVTDNLAGATGSGEIACLPPGAPEVLGEIGALLAGRLRLPGEGGRRVFDSVGVAHADTAVAAAVADAAVAAGLGATWDQAG